MSDPRRLSSYFARQSVKRLQLDEPLATHVNKIVDLMEKDDSRATVADVHRALFPFSTTASANASLNRLVRQFNERAQTRGIQLGLQMTTAKSGGASKRFIWFEGPTPAPPATRTTELDSIPPDRLLSSRGEAPQPVVVLITYNEHETAAVFDRFAPGGGASEHRAGRSFTRLGAFHGWQLVHLVSGQGEGQSQLSTAKAIAAWHPRAVIAVGIAFGVDSAKQSIGDVLVSESIQGYDLARVNADGTLTLRETARPASDWLLQRAISCDYQLRRDPARWPTVRPGVVLSGSKLVDDLDYRDSLLRLVPQKVVGGEMEGAGLAIAADAEKVDWIVVKGICDWADGHKGASSKDRDQRLAADNAVTLVEEILQETPPLLPSHALAEAATHRAFTGMPSSHRMRLAALDEIDPTCLIEQPRGMPSTMDKEETGSGLRGRLAGESDGVDVLVEVLSWVDEPGAIPVFALLGEYGMGKTVTAQRLARELEIRRADDPARPAALYFDLRSVTGLDRAVPTLAQVVEECMSRDWVAEGDSAAYTWANVLSWLASGAVVIFDGLDEVLVKLDTGDGRTFTRTLLGIVEEQRARGGQARVVITCRTQYFRTLREQSNHFTGQERGNTREDVFRALVLLPLTEAQILAYLRAALPGTRPHEILDMVRTVHNLTDLAQRPFTLRLISQFLPDIEADRQAGRTVYGVTLYRRMVDRWLERDAGKHHLRPEDKIELAEHLAAHFHASDTNSLAADALEDWMHAWLAASPRLARRYARLHPDHLEEDLRTATFLARIDGTQGSGFRFAHTSLGEYFHACHLLRAIADDRPNSWDVEPPSPESLQFLGQLLAERRDPDLMSRLTTWAQQRGGRVARLVLAYAVAAAGAGWPTPSLRKIDLTGADLSERLISGRPTGPRLDLREARMETAKLRGAAFRHVDLTGAQLAGANARQTVFADSTLTASRFAAADCTSAAFVRCDSARIEPSTIIGRSMIVSAPSSDGHLRPVHDGYRELRWSGLNRLSEINATAYSPDGTHLASAGLDGTVRIWALATATTVATLTGHTGEVLAVAYSPDGSHLASAGIDGTVRIWDLATGTAVTTLAGHTGGVFTVAYSLDGSHLASAGIDGTVRIWDLATGTAVTTLAGHTGGVFTVAYSPDGTHLVSTGQDGVRLWDPATGTSVATLTGHTGGVQAVAYSPDGTHLASASDDGTVRIWDLATCTAGTTLTGHTGGVQAVAYSPDGTHLAGAALDGTVRVWDLAAGIAVTTLSAHTRWLEAVAYSPDGTHLASAGSEVRIWDLATASAVTTLTGHAGGVQAVAYSPDGTHLASAARDGVRIWNLATGTAVTTLTSQAGGVQAVAYSPDGTHLASTDWGGVRIWDLATATTLATLTGHTGWVQAVAYHPGGTHLASAGRDGTMRIWDLATGACVRSHGVVATDSLGGGGVAVWDPRIDQILHATGDAWRCLAWLPRGTTDWSRAEPIECSP